MDKSKFSRTTLLFIYFFLAAITAKAGGLTPAWTKETRVAVTWQKVTSLGQIVCCSSRGLIGINPVTGDELWMIEALKNSPGDSYAQIPNSPFISLSSGDDRKGIFIIDPLEGKILFSSKAANLENVTDKFFLYENYKILVIGNPASEKSTVLVMVDMGNGKKLWSKSGDFSFTTGVKDLGNDEVLITSAFFASKLKASTGDEIWKSAIDPQTAGMSNLLGKLEGFASKQVTKEEVMAQLITSPLKPDIFLIAAQKKNESTKVDSKGAKSVVISYSAVYMAFDLQTGAYKWPSVVEMHHPLGVTYATADGLIVCAGNGGAINMLSYTDGSRLLGKKGNGLSLKGRGTGFVPLSDGKILTVSDNGNNSALMVLDVKSGTFDFEKAAKINGMVSYTELLPNGALVATNEEVNLLNLKTGEWYREDGIPGGAALIGTITDKILVCNTKDGLLYQLEKSGTQFRPFATSVIKLQGKEKPTALEVRDEGILLTSEQNLAMVDFSGAVKFNQYFPAPTNSDFKKALLIASAVRAAYATAVLTTYSAAFGAASQSIVVKDVQSKAAKDVTADVSRVLGEASVTGAKYTVAYIKMAQQRFKATTQAANYMLIMTAATKKDIQLLQVNKTTGEVMNTISIGKDKDPVYDVDLVDGRLYYMKDVSKMESYKF
jgi:hypothetical protein